MEVINKERFDLNFFGTTFTSNSVRLCKNVYFGILQPDC